MTRALILGAAALVVSAAGASAQVYTTPDYGYGEPVADLVAPADGYATPAPHRRTPHRLSMQPRFIQHHQSTWCRSLSTQHRRWYMRRPWFRGQYMPTRPGIGVATGMVGTAATATGMLGGAKPAASRRLGPL